MDKKFTYQNKSLFSYRDNETSNDLIVTLDSSISRSDEEVTNYKNKVSLAINNTGFSGSNHVKISLEFFELFSIVDQMEKIFSKSMKEIFSENPHVYVTKTDDYRNITRQLVFDFITENDTPKVHLTIKDPSSSLQKAILKLSPHAFKGLRTILVQVKDNYCMLSLNQDSSLLINEMSHSLVGIIDNKFSQMIGTMKSLNNTIFENSDKSELGVIKDIETPFEFEEDEHTSEGISFEDSFQRGFESALTATDGFNNIKLDLPEDNYTKSTIIEMKNSGLISKFLQNDVLEINKWTDSILNVSYDSSDMLYEPIRFFLERSNLLTDSLSEDLKSEDVYKINALIVKYCKAGIREYLTKGSYGEYGLLPTGIQSLVRKHKELQDISYDMFILIIIYGLFINNYLSHVNLGKEGSSKIENYNRTRFLIKTIFGPIIYSITEDDKEKILDRYNELFKNNFLKNLMDEYSTLTMGGTLNITYSDISSSLDKITKLLSNSNNSISPSYYIAFDMTSINDIKDYVFDKGIYSKETERTNNKEVDVRLTKYIEVVKHMNPESYDTVKSLNTYEELKECLSKSNMPMIMYKIKRAIDLFHTENKNASLMDIKKKAIEYQTESDDITVNMVLSQEAEPVILSERDSVLLQEVLFNR